MFICTQEPNDLTAAVKGAELRLHQTPMAWLRGSAMWFGYVVTPAAKLTNAAPGLYAWVHELFAQQVYEGLSVHRRPLEVTQ